MTIKRIFAVPIGVLSMLSLELHRRGLMRWNPPLVVVIIVFLGVLSFVEEVWWPLSTFNFIYLFYITLTYIHNKNQDKAIENIDGMIPVVFKPYEDEPTVVFLINMDSHYEVGEALEGYMNNGFPIDDPQLILDHVKYSCDISDEDIRLMTANDNVSLCLLLEAPFLEYDNSINKKLHDQKRKKVG